MQMVTRFGGGPNRLARLERYLVRDRLLHRDCAGYVAGTVEICGDSDMRALAEILACWEECWIE